MSELSIRAVQRLCERDAKLRGLTDALHEIDAATHIVHLRRDRKRTYLYGTEAECQNWAAGFRECVVAVFTAKQKRDASAHMRRAWA